MNAHAKQQPMPWDISSEILSNVSSMLRPSNDEGDLQPIGPWMPAIEDGQPAFVREPMQGHDFIWWKPSFEREVIRPRQDGDPCRVCVIGESAAAGMFYTPHCTPTTALAQHLSTVGGAAQTFEVLDLTRNSMNATELVSVTSAALQLRPNYVVVFAGNNWFSGQGFHWEGESGERAVYAETIAGKGISGMLETFQDRIRNIASMTVSLLGELVTGTGTKVVFVIPGVNPLWERSEPVLWLGGGNTSRWFELHAAATRALAGEDWRAALHAAGDMIALDSGTCSTSHCIRGKALLGLGLAEDAARAFDDGLANANAFESYCQVIPGAPAYVREQIRKTAADAEIACIDLPAVFSEYTGSPVDVRSLFVDYCHLTPLGMNVAMAAVATNISQREVPDAKDDWKALASSAQIAVDDRVEAIARFYTAIYASHLEHTVLPSDGAKIAERIRSACELAPSIVPFVTDYVRAKNGAVISCSLIRGAAQRAIHPSNNPFMDYATVRGAGGVDAVTMEAIGSALDAVGADGKETIADYFEFYERELENGVDLTEPLYVEDTGFGVPWLKYETERVTRRALPYFRAIWPVSRFTLVAGTERDVDISLVCRVPGISNAARTVVRVSINGEPLDELPTRNAWKRHKLHIPARQLRKGANRLTVEWPPLAAEELRAWNEAQRRNRIGERPDIFPVFGEIFSCFAKAR